MSDNSVLAREFPLHVNTGTTASPTWTLVDGIKTITVNPQKKDAESNVFSSGGWIRKRVTARGLSISADGLAFYDEDGVKDPGQVACEEYARALGAAGEGDFLIHLPGDEGMRFTAAVSCTEFGGGLDDLTQWKLELDVNSVPVYGPLA